MVGFPHLYTPKRIIFIFGKAPIVVGDFPTILGVAPMLDQPTSQLPRPPGGFLLIRRPEKLRPRYDVLLFLGFFCWDATFALQTKFWKRKKQKKEDWSDFFQWTFPFKMILSLLWMVKIKELVTGFFFLQFYPTSLKWKEATLETKTHLCFTFFPEPWLWEEGYFFTPAF